MQDKSEFLTIIKEYEKIIFKVTLLYTSDHEDQKDLFQEIVFQLWKSFHRFRGDSKISTWIYRVALNTAITHVKRSKHRTESLSTEEFALAVIDPSDEGQQERIRQLYLQIEYLNKIDKGIILLYLEGNSHEEIARITGFTKSNVGTRLGRIKQRLKSGLLKKQSYGIR